MSQANVNVVPAAPLNVASPLATLSTNHFTPTGRLVVVPVKVIPRVPGSEIVVAVLGELGASVLIAGAKALPGLLMTASCRAVRVWAPSAHAMSTATRL